MWPAEGKGERPRDSLWTAPYTIPPSPYWRPADSLFTTSPLAAAPGRSPEAPPSPTSFPVSPAQDQPLTCTGLGSAVHLSCGENMRVSPAPCCPHHPRLGMDRGRQCVQHHTNVLRAEPSPLGLVVN